MGRGAKGRVAAAVLALAGAAPAAAASGLDGPSIPAPPRTGVRLMLGAGFEGYSGELGEAYDLGPLAGVGVALQLLPALSVELGYTLGLHQVNVQRKGGLVDGYDVLRHGAQAALTLGPLLWPGLRPYGFVGFGVGWTHVRGPPNPTYRDDRDGYVPLGGGLALSAGRFLLDARLGYQVLLGQDSVSAPDGTGERASGGRVQALVSFGFVL